MNPCESVAQLESVNPLPSLAVVRVLKSSPMFATHFHSSLLLLTEGNMQFLF